MMWLGEARMIAAQCWCDEETKHLPMDYLLAEAVAHRIAAWMDTAGQNAQNADYWRGRAQQAEMIIDQASRALGGENMADQAEAFDTAARLLASIGRAS